MLSLIENAAIQGLSYGIGVIGLVLAIRILRYPDLTADGSFLLGAVAYAAIIGSSGNWGLAMGAAFVAGSLAGICTSFLNVTLGVNRLLSGILTTMMAYSVGYRLLGNRPNISVDIDSGIFGLGGPLDGFFAASASSLHLGQVAICLVVATAVSTIVLYLLRSEVGLLLRATGMNSRLVDELQRNTRLYQTLGLALANGLIALSASIVAARQGFVDINMGVGVVITLIAALVIGESVSRWLPLGSSLDLRKRVLAAFAGATLYFFFYLMILRASINGLIPWSVNPTDLKFFSAVLVAAALAARGRKLGREEAFPL